ncbi:hypothetical protein BSL78_02632 [Apostichopus japonicus]|uniref:Uncharacterized protein n=1 Tax=Stichopus japonicus TaxID=307972 RepID=A0A2G8LJN1_STIJA|nr:hypothetical protein BSL78_02632 [Apostichopus japonicus]
MSETDVSNDPQGQDEVQEDVHPLEAASNDFVLVDDDNSHEPLETEVPAKEEVENAASETKEDYKEEYADTHEELPVEGEEDEEHPVEEEEGETMDEDDFEDTAGDDQSVKSASMTPKDIHNMVNDALDFKLGNFQAQLHQMMSVIQNVSKQAAMAQKQAEQVVKGKVEDGEAKQDEDQPGKEQSERAMNVDVPDKGKAQQTTEEDGTTESKKKDAQATGKVLWEDDEEKVKWEEYLYKVSSLLDVMPPTAEKSVLDDTVSSSNQSSCSYLPAEGIVKKSWQKVKEKSLIDVASVSKKQNHRYYWPMEDMKAYGWNPRINSDMVPHIVKAQGSGGKRRNILPENLSRLNHDIQSTDDLFRYQLRIISYASYFLAGLGKIVKGEKSAEEEIKHDLLNNLGQCLIDLCDTSVKGSIFATRGRRRVYLDALKINNNKARSEVVNQPLAFELFSAEYKSSFENHHVHLPDGNSETPKRQVGGSGRSGGGGGSGGGGVVEGGGGGGGGVVVVVVEIIAVVVVGVEEGEMMAEELGLRWVTTLVQEVGGVRLDKVTSDHQADDQLLTGTEATQTEKADKIMVVNRVVEERGRILVTGG